MAAPRKAVSGLTMAAKMAVPVRPVVTPNAMAWKGLKGERAHESYRGKYCFPKVFNVVLSP